MYSNVQFLHIVVANIERWLKNITKQIIMSPYMFGKYMGKKEYTKCTKRITYVSLGGTIGASVMYALLKWHKVEKIAHNILHSLARIFAHSFSSVKSFFISSLIPLSLVILITIIKGVYDGNKNEQVDDATLPPLGCSGGALDRQSLLAAGNGGRDQEDNTAALQRRRQQLQQSDLLDDDALGGGDHQEDNTATRRRQPAVNFTAPDLPACGDPCCGYEDHDAEDLGTNSTSTTPQEDTLSQSLSIS